MNSMKVQIRLLLLLIFFSFTEAGAQKLQVDSLERVLEEHRTDDTAKVNLLNRIALVLSAQDTKKSRSYAEQSEKLSKQLNYQKGKAASVWITGLTYIQSDKRLAISFIEEAVDIAEKAGDKAGASNYLMNIGNLKIEIGDVEKGEEYYDKAYRLAKELQDKKLIIIILYNLSRSQTRKGNYPKAIEQLQEVIRIENELGGRKMLATAYGQMGFIYSRQGSNPIALEYYLYALKVNEELMDDSGRFYNLINIAAIQSDQKDYEAALKTVHRAFKLSQDMGDSLRISTCLISIGKIHMAMKNPVAIKYFERALSITKDNNMSQSVTILTNIGSIYTEQGEYDQALKSFEKALTLAQKIMLKRGFCEIWIKMGVLYYQQKQYLRAVEYAKKALELAKDLKLLEVQQDSYQLLSELYAVTGAFHEAYEAHVEYKSISDSIFSEKNVRKIALLESSYEFDKEKQEYAMEKASRMLEIKNQRLTIFCLTIVSLLVFILAFAIYWSNKLKKKVLQLKIENINHDLEMNQKAMAAATLKLVQSSERDANSIKILENVEKNMIEESQREIRSLIADYKFKSYTSNWEEFEIMFEKINSSFYEKLNTRYPTLTPNERKLCVFLKLNMSNNHISQITFQSEDALKKARLRLRKKLEIGREVNLTAFIQSL